MRFTKLYEELKFSDVFSAASPEEVAERKEKYAEMNVKEALDNAKKTKLEDGSWYIYGDLDISECGLITLKNLNVSKIDGNFYCSFNTFTSLVGAPKEVVGDFYCYGNNLTNLVGAPKEVVGEFFCYNNQLTSLVGAPKEVGRDFYCDNNKLTNLVGAPKEVGGNFACFTNKLTSLEGAPNKVGRDFFCYNNKKKFTSDEVRAVCDVKGSITI